MTLKEYILQMPEGDEVTVIDDTYDMEVYFYNQNFDAWDDAMMTLASKLNVVSVADDDSDVVVDLYGLIERNIDNPEFPELFVNVDVDDIMDDMENILAGGVSENWLTRFANCLTA